MLRNPASDKHCSFEVSSVVGAFEGVVAILPVVICFQSLILDMAGNVGTQSLAVTIRVLMDENLSGADKLRLLVALVLAFCEKGLVTVALCACGAVLITEWIFSRMSGL